MELCSYERVETITKWKLIYFGHIMNKCRDCVVKDIIERLQMTSIDNIKTLTGLMIELTNNGCRNTLSKMLK